MKAIIFSCLAFFVACAVAGDLHCENQQIKIPTSWIDMVNPCVKQMRAQIQEELKASLQYLAMGAHFSRDTVNRPGFAKHFFEAASEERQHAIKLIEYLLMRGELTSDISTLIKTFILPEKTEWPNAVSALEDALELEASVTRKIRDVIKVCEDTTNNDKAYNDYHLVDYLTGDFLEEQYHGQRELAGQISQLQKMMKQHGEIGEFLFDKKLLG